MTNRNLRINAGFSQKKLADEIGVKRQTIIKWETGERPLRKHYPKLAEALNCTTDTLFEAWKETIKLMGGKING